MSLVLVCGSRDYPEDLRWWVRDAISRLPKGSVVMTGAARGPDAWALDDAHDLGYEFIAVPADWDTHVEGCGCTETVGPRGGRRYCRTAGFRRNQDMIDRKPVEVLSFWDGKSTGTHDTIKKSVHAGLPVRLFIPPKRGAKLSLWSDEPTEFSVTAVSVSGAPISAP